MQLVRYEEARRALAEYKTVDEVKDFRDKVLAIEAYAKQANDFDLERDAAIARVRAERKCGQLLAETEKAKGQLKQGNSLPQSHATTTGDKPKTLAEMGVTKDQSSKWQQLAKVPEKEFEAAINLPGSVPSANHLLKKDAPEPVKRMNKDALWVWGRLRDLQPHFRQPLSELKEDMTENMLRDVEAIIPQLRSWIDE